MSTDINANRFGSCAELKCKSTQTSAADFVCFSADNHTNHGLTWIFGFCLEYIDGNVPLSNWYYAPYTSIEQGCTLNPYQFNEEKFCDLLATFYFHLDTFYAQKKIADKTNRKIETGKTHLLVFDWKKSFENKTNQF